MMNLVNILISVIVMAALASCGGGGGGEKTAVIEPPQNENPPPSTQPILTGYFSTQPIASISISDPAACFTQFVNAVDMDSDGKKDLAMHFWCDQFNVTEGFDGPTPNTFKVYLNKGDRFENGTFQLFGTDNVTLGGASRKVVEADFNNDGKIDLAYAVNKEDGRPIGSNVSLAASQSSVVTSNAAGSYSVARLGAQNWYHAVDVYEKNSSSKSVVFQGFNNIPAQVFFRSSGAWVVDGTPLPSLSGLTFRFMKSSPILTGDDLVVTVGQNDATELDLFSRTDVGWQKVAGYYPAVTRGSVPTIGFNGDSIMGNRIDIDGILYTGAGFDDSCVLSKTPGSSLFIGKFSGRKLPDGYNGETVKEVELPLVYELMAFNVDRSALRKIDLGLKTPLGTDFFNFIDCADVNNDGYGDIVISTQRSGGLPDIYIGAQGGGFTKVSMNAFPVVERTRGDSRAILSDLDGDGLRDLVVFTLSSVPQSIKVYKGLRKL